VSSLARLSQEPTIRRILLEHASRGVTVQVVLRCVLAAFVLLVVIVVPPAEDARACLAIAIAYLLWSAVVALVPQRLVLYVWLALLVDVVALTAVTTVAGLSDDVSWTADILITGFFVLPVLAATQLRPWICVAVVVPTVGAFFWSAVVARQANGEPWSSVLLRTLVLVGVGVGCILLTRVQRSRVDAIGDLAADRSALLDETLQLEDRVRRALSEHLHDGALQYVLAARQELPDVHDDPEALARVEHALRETSQLLRSTMTELNPAVLEAAGLPAALRSLVGSTGARAGLATAVEVRGWPRDERTSADGLLFATARELLTNVVKHAHASRVDVSLTLSDGVARLVVADDGVGVDPEQAARRVGEGHIGLASRRIRLESEGGGLRLEPGDRGGTSAVAELPLHEV
jgi:two-component system NarL family sensor kinase